jgi:hypothetical protein
MWEAESGHDVTNSELVGRTSLEIYRRFPSSPPDSSVVSRKSSVTSATNSPGLYASLSPVHSPASSVCSSFSKSEDESCDQLKPRPLRVKKTVSFYLSPPTITSPSESRFATTNLRASRVFQSGLEDRSSPPKGGYTTATPPVNTITSGTMSSLLLSRSITRYNIYLTTLRNRLNHHLSNITELILSIESAQYHSSKINLDQSCVKDKGGNLTTIFDDYTPVLPDVTESEQEEKAQQRRARIAQLKQRGIDWKLGRGRFDGSRYKRLCQETLRELQV